MIIEGVDDVWLLRWWRLHVNPAVKNIGHLKRLAADAPARAKASGEAERQADRIARLLREVAA